MMKILALIDVTLYIIMSYIYIVLLHRYLHYALFF